MICRFQYFFKKNLKNIYYHFKYNSNNNPNQKKIEHFQRFLYFYSNQIFKLLYRNIIYIIFIYLILCKLNIIKSILMLIKFYHHHHHYFYFHYIFLMLILNIFLIIYIFLIFIRLYLNFNRYLLICLNNLLNFL